MARWLSLSSFDGRITLPRAFDLTVLTPFVTEIVEDWLADLITTKRVLDIEAWLNTDPFAEPADQSIPLDYPADLYALVEPFLVYACWAEFILKGSAQAGTTGLVVKKTDATEQLSDAHRAELHRSFKTIAERKASKLIAYINLNKTDCAETTNGATTIRFSSARGRTQSLF